MQYQRNGDGALQQHPYRIRRAGAHPRWLAGEGYGKIALPGGYQMLSQTWQEAGACEVLEETGIVVSPEALRAVAVENHPGSAAEPAVLPESSGRARGRICPRCGGLRGPRHP